TKSTSADMKSSPLESKKWHGGSRRAFIRKLQTGTGGTAAHGRVSRAAILRSSTGSALRAGLRRLREKMTTPVKLPADAAPVGRLRRSKPGYGNTGQRPPKWGGI